MGGRCKKRGGTELAAGRLRSAKRDGTSIWDNRPRLDEGVLQVLRVASSSSQTAFSSSARRQLDDEICGTSNDGRPHGQRQTADLRRPGPGWSERLSSVETAGLECSEARLRPQLGCYGRDTDSGDAHCWDAAYDFDPRRKRCDEYDEEVEFVKMKSETAPWETLETSTLTTA